MLFTLEINERKTWDSKFFVNSSKRMKSEKSVFSMIFFSFFFSWILSTPTFQIFQAETIAKYRKFLLKYVMVRNINKNPFKTVKQVNHKNMTIQPFSLKILYGMTQMASEFLGIPDMLLEVMLAIANLGNIWKNKLKITKYFALFAIFTTSK